MWNPLRYCPFFQEGKSICGSKSLHPVARQRIEELHGECDFDELTVSVMQQSTFAAAAEVRYALELCRQANAFDYSVRFEDRVIATLRPLSPAFQIRKGAASGVLSRFAYLRRVDSRMALASPRVDAQLDFPEDAADALALVLRGTVAGQVREAPILRLLAETGFLDSIAEDDSPACFWEFHDLLFHRASRLGQSARPAGATWRFQGSLAPFPAVKHAMSTEAIRLGVPTPPSPAPAFHQVLSNRRSLRQPGEHPITLGELAGFLYRSVAIRDRFSAGENELLLRAYPSGGAIHELEYYVAVRRCTGLDAGLYHYHPAEHALYRLPCKQSDLDRLAITVVQSWAGMYAEPDLIIVLAARLPRIAWKYEGMAYRTILINVGAAIQTMYLVATDMNLAPCAIGNGDPARFASMTGLDPLGETSVAEFTLSSRA